VTPYGAPLRAELVANLRAHPRRTAADVDGVHRATVAVFVFDDGSGGAAFLLCRRAAKLNRHARQWALPGGRIDLGETVEEAALREVHEELGLLLDAGSLLGTLDDYPTRSGFAITPVVLWAGGTVELHPDPREVAAVHTIALDELQREDSPRFVTIPDSPRPVVQVPIGAHLVHAPTGAVLVQFRWVALEGRAGQRVDHFEQPRFAWR
jgi:8-oxo-dGTP pyrophosphatase MutT (NUDIX family)